jgi:hypothetical protein
MSEQIFPANQRGEIIRLGLQVFQVLFLWLHDWIPLGQLNDVAAVRSQAMAVIAQLPLRCSRSAAFLSARACRAYCSSCW